MWVLDAIYYVCCIIIIIIILYCFYTFMDGLTKLASDNAKALKPVYPWYYMPTWVMDAWTETFPICLRSVAIISAKI
jgi:hypothetical protein